MPSGPLVRLAAWPLAPVDRPLASAAWLPASCINWGESVVSWGVCPVAPSALGTDEGPWPATAGVPSGAWSAVLTRPPTAPSADSATGNATTAHARAATVRRRRRLPSGLNLSARRLLVGPTPKPPSSSPDPAPGFPSLPSPAAKVMPSTVLVHKCLPAAHPYA